MKRWKRAKAYQDGDWPYYLKEDGTRVVSDYVAVKRLLQVWKRLPEVPTKKKGA